MEAKTLDFHHSTSLRIRQCRLYLLEKGHQVDSITDTNVGDPNIGTSTFIVTNDTAVNSPLTPSRVGSNKQERTCSPLLPSASSTLPSVFFFFILPSFPSTNAPGCSVSTTVSYRNWNSVHPSQAATSARFWWINRLVPCGLRSWKIGWDFVVDIVVVADRWRKTNSVYVTT